LYKIRQAEAREDVFRGAIMEKKAYKEALRKEVKKQLDSVRAATGLNHAAFGCVSEKGARV
jgi:hypothetical protein